MFAYANELWNACMPIYRLLKKKKGIHMEYYARYAGTLFYYTGLTNYIVVDPTVYII